MNTSQQCSEVSGTELASRPIGTVCFDRATLKQRLTPLQYSITQEKRTERAFSGRYNKHYEPGVYRCVVCGLDLFSSSTKYDSGSGWPSFYDVLESHRVKLKPDLSHVGGNLLLLIARPGLERTEVSCSRCSSHLGHLFKDGPRPTGLRYCVNSESLQFRADPSADNTDGSSVGLYPGSCARGAQNNCNRPEQNATGAPNEGSNETER